MKSINKAVEVSAQTTRNVLKRDSMRFAAVLLAALAIFVAVPNAALAAAPQHHDLPTRADPADLARYIATILYGKAVQSAGSASRGKLQRVIEMALRTLPL